MGNANVEENACLRRSNVCCSRSFLFISGYREDSSLLNSQINCWINHQIRLRELVWKDIIRRSIWHRTLNRLVHWSLQAAYFCPPFQILSFRSETFKQIPTQAFVKNWEATKERDLGEKGCLLHPVLLAARSFRIFPQFFSMRSLQNALPCKQWT